MGDITALIQTAKRIAAIVPTSEAGETLAGLADALEALATEWEYAARITPPSGSYGDDVFYEYPDLLAVDRFIKFPPLWYSPRSGEIKAIVRRRKAGPWVEVSS